LSSETTNIALDYDFSLGNESYYLIDACQFGFTGVEVVRNIGMAIRLLYMVVCRRSSQPLTFLLATELREIHFCSKQW